MYVRRDNGETILDDMNGIINRAKMDKNPILVVPTEREVKAILKNFPDTGIKVMTIDEFREKKWFTEDPNTSHSIYGFRIEQMFASLCCGLEPKCVSVRIPSRNKHKEE